MLWEVILEMLGELFKALGEILTAFWQLLKAVFGYSENMPEEERRKKQKKLLVFCAACLAIGAAFLFPGVRKFFFGGGRPA